MTTTTMTITQFVHTRPRRLSLIASRQSQFLNLPIEISLGIFEATVLECKPNDLALVSKAFCKVLDAVLYRTVVLDSPKVIQLFHRTIHSKKRSFLADHVKRLVVTRWPENTTTYVRIHEIIAACTGLRALVSPSYHWPVNISAAKLAAESGLNAITLQAFDRDYGVQSHVARQSAVIDFSRFLTHLRFCEPSDMWYSPTTIIAEFGPLPHLTHLQLARRANANEDNDLVFASGIRQLLRCLPALKMLVISIFNSSFPSDLVEDSSIWKRMCDIRSKDRRVFVVQGGCDEWKEGWENHKLLCSGQYPTDFWASVSNRSSMSVA